MVDQLQEGKSQSRGEDKKTPWIVSENKQTTQSITLKGRKVSLLSRLDSQEEMGEKKGLLLI